MKKNNVMMVLPKPAKEAEAERLKDLLETQLEQIKVHWITNEKEVWERVQIIDYDLIIAHLYIPADSGSVPNEPLGLVLMEKLKDYKKNIPKILVIPRKEQELGEKVKNFSQTYIMFEEEMFQTKMLDLVQQLLFLGMPVVKKPEGRIDLYINLKETVLDNVLGRYLLRSGDFSPPIGTLQFNRESLRKLSEQSDGLITVTEYDKWEKKLREIGIDLYKELSSEKNKNFYKLFNRMFGKVNNDIRNIRIIFHIMKECSSIMFEAIIEEPEDRFWMLQAPIYRCLMCESGMSGEVFEPSFRNILIIDADTAGSDEELTDCDDREIKLSELPHLKKECDWLEYEFFPKQKQQGKVDLVERIKRKQGEDFYKTVTEALNTHEWNLIHYAGHSVYGRYKGKEGGYLIFPHPDDPDKLHIKDIKYFCMHLRKTGLMYLSSCASAGSYFVFEMAGARVPAIIGFRWKIADGLAFEFAKTFYQQLFQEGTPETAFRATRSIMYEYDEESRIWAAPILIMQG